MMVDPAQELLMRCPPWAAAFTHQQQAVKRFHEGCQALLEPACPLSPLDEAATTIERNLFSTLFLLALQAAGVAEERLPLYALVNQCLRAQVTGCDNLLDDEYKSVIPFALSGSGIRFRSVLTVMGGDLVLARLILAEVVAGRLSHAQGEQLLSAVMAVLIPSGLEEHEEESLLQQEIPTLEQMLNKVHYRKTGLLFEAPLRLAETMGDVDPAKAREVAQALSRFGLGCQILDDLKDVAEDMQRGKFNVVLSAAWHGANDAERRLVADYLLTPPSPEVAQQHAASLATARAVCSQLAIEHFLHSQQALSRCLPAFGLAEATALGGLVQGAILSERNESLLRGQA